MFTAGASRRDAFTKNAKPTGSLNEEKHPQMELSGLVQSITAVGNTLYLGMCSAGVIVVDSRDPAAPVQPDTLPTQGCSGGLAVFSLANPAHPQEVRRIPWPRWKGIPGRSATWPLPGDGSSSRTRRECSGLWTCVIPLARAYATAGQRTQAIGESSSAVQRLPRENPRPSSFPRTWDCTYLKYLASE